MKNDLLRMLAPWGVDTLEVHRDDELHGEPAYGIDLEYVDDDGRRTAEFKFAKINNMSTDQIATVIVSYIENPTGDENT
jgi:hypothetical protein